MSIDTEAIKNALEDMRGLDYLKENAEESEIKVIKNGFYKTAGGFIYYHIGYKKGGVPFGITFKELEDGAGYVAFTSILVNSFSPELDEDGSIKIKASQNPLHLKGGAFGRLFNVKEKLDAPEELVDYVIKFLKDKGINIKS